MRICAHEDIERALRDGHCLVVDVREAAEFEAVHIEGAFSYPLSALAGSGLSHEKCVYLVCRSDARARRAAAILEKQGHLGIMVLEGGLEAWIRSGRPVVRAPRKTGRLERFLRSLFRGGPPDGRAAR